MRIAVSTEFIPESEHWLALADPTNAINTRVVWKTHFAPWAVGAETTALAAAREQFRPIATDVLGRRRTELRRDRDRLHEWFDARTREIIGDRGLLAVDQDLPGLGQHNPQRPTTARWAGLSDPLERLAGFASDNAQPVALRHEAQTVLTLFKKRRDDLDAHETIRDPEVTVLGMLMIVPST